MFRELLSYLWMRLWWKPVFHYYHREAGETVELHRHRLTRRLRRVWYDGIYGDD